MRYVQLPMKQWATALACLSISALAPAQKVEAERLVSRPPDTQGIQRMLEILETGSDRAKIVIMDDLGKNALAYEWYVDLFGKPFVDGKKIVSAPEHPVASKYRGFPELLYKFAIGRTGLSDIAVRTLARIAGNSTPQYGEPLGFCAVGLWFASVDRNSARQLERIAKLRPELLQKQVGGTDTKMLDGLLTALINAKVPLPEQFLRQGLVSSDEKLRYLCLIYFRQLAWTESRKATMRGLLSTNAQIILRWAATCLDANDVRVLYGDVPFHALPRSARYAALSEDREHPQYRMDLKSVAMNDPDPDVAIRASIMARYDAGLPKVALAERYVQATYDFQRAQSCFYKLLAEAGADEWTRISRKSNLIGALMMLSSLDMTHPRAEELTRAILDKVSECDDKLRAWDFLLMLNLGSSDNERFTGLLDDMLESPSPAIRLCAARGLINDDALAGRYLNQISVDPEPLVQLTIRFAAPAFKDQHISAITRVLKRHGARNEVLDHIGYLSRKQTAEAIANLLSFAEGNDPQYAEYARLQLSRLKKS